MKEPEGSKVELQDTSEAGERASEKTRKEGIVERTTVHGALFESSNTDGEGGDRWGRWWG